MNNITHWQLKHANKTYIKNTSGWLKKQQQQQQQQQQQTKMIQNHYNNSDNTHIYNMCLFCLLLYLKTIKIQFKTTTEQLRA